MTNIDFKFYFKIEMNLNELDLHLIGLFHTFFF